MIIIFVDYITSLVDYPDKVCTTCFTIGCNLHCGYCYNSKIVNGKEIKYLAHQMAVELLKRQKMSKYVCITGGEPTIHAKHLIPFLKFMYKKGFKIKLDTNGTNAHVLRKCLPYLDYIALDIKTSPNDYYIMSYPNDFPIQKLRDSIKLIKESGIKYELRTVMFPFLVNIRNFEDIVNLVGWMGNPMLYRLTQFNPKEAMYKWCRQTTPYTKEKIMAFAKAFKSYGITNVKVTI